MPEDYLRSAHAAVSKRFAEEISKLEGIHLRVVDTTHRPNKVIAERLSAGDRLVIKDEALFRRFLLKAEARR